jgi:hypothetical protein
VSGNANELQAKSASQLRKESLAYVENMTKLSSLTGKQAEQLQADQDVAMSEYEELAKQRQENAQIAQLKSEGRNEEAAAIKKEQQNRAEYLKEAAAFYGPAEAAKLGRMARTGVYDQFTGSMAVLGVSASELKENLKNASSGAAVFTNSYDEINKKTGDMAMRVGDALQFMGEEGGTGVGLARGFLEANQKYGDKSLADAKAQAEETLKARKTESDDLADAVENVRSQERQFQAAYQEQLLKGVMYLAEAFKNVDLFNIVAENFTSILKGLGAAILGVTALSGGLAIGAAALTARMIGGGAAGAAGTAGAAGAAGAGGLLSRAGGFAKGLLGKVALPVMAGMALYDAYKGYTADPNASFGDKLGNAGSSALNGLSFGLLGSSATDLASKSVPASQAAAANLARTGVLSPATAGAAGQYIGSGVDPETMEEMQESLASRNRDTAASLEEQQIASTKLLGTTGTLDDTLGSTNKSLKLFKELLDTLNMTLGGPDAANGGGGAAPNMGGMGGGNDPNKILSTIRQMESGNNYTAQNPTSSASGAYQFIDSTWQSLTKKLGIGTEFKKAKDAPPAIQDQVAAAHLQEIMGKAGGDISKVPTAWFTGNVQGKSSAVSPEQVQAYVQKWMGIYGSMPGGGMGGQGGQGGLIGLFQQMSGAMGGMGMMGGMGGDQNIVNVGRMLQDQYGLRISEHPAFGGILASHRGRGHYEGRAIDVNIGRGNREADNPEQAYKFDMIADQLRRAGLKVIWRSAGHYDHMHVETPGSKGMPMAERGGILKGPDSGYTAMLHGTEMVVPLDNKFTRSMTGVNNPAIDKNSRIQQSVIQMVSAETNKAIKAINETNAPMQNISAEISNSMRKVMSAHNDTMNQLAYKLSEMIDAMNTSNDVTKKILKKASA